MMEIPYWLFIAFIFFSAPTAVFLLAGVCVGISLTIAYVADAIIINVESKRKEKEDEGKN